MIKPSLLLNNALKKYTAALLAVCMLNSAVFPTVSLALSSGPSQPEVQSFEPIGTSDMVDVFSGDFNYNLPLMKVGNYPINLFYHGGVGMDDEASWVGLGWNINPGVINRQMRGLPDDFKNDPIEKSTHIRPNNTFSLAGGLGLQYELFGWDVLSLKPEYTVYYNNYKGLGQSLNLNIGIGAGNVSFGYDSQSGIDVDAGLSLSKVIKNSEISGKTSLNGNVSIGFNSRAGLKGLTLGMGFSRTSQSRRHSAGSSSSGLLAFAGPTFTPNVNPDMVNRSFSLGFSLGGSIFGNHIKAVTGRGSFSTQRLRNNGETETFAGMGYLYAGDYNYDTEDSKMLDFNRDKDADISKTTRYLHTTIQTFDTYSISGQGTGGAFRPYRDNIGAVADPTQKTTALGGINAGVEVGIGDPHFGVDVTAIISNSRSGRWAANDGFSPFTHLRYTNGDNVSGNGPLAEPVYMKSIGDMAPNDQLFYNKFGDTQPVYLPLTSPGTHNYNIGDVLKNKNDAPVRQITGSIKRSGRDKRNQAISYLTAFEAQSLALDKTLKYYEADRNYVGEFNLDDNDAIIPVPRILNRGGDAGNPHEYKKPHHISEVTVTNTDGSRYVYGIAAYNTEQTEFTFSVDPNNGNTVSGGLVEIGSDDINSNGKGREHYSSKTKTPGYAHSYLLTTVLSADYVDLAGDGPTEDDLGDYTKINYVQIHDNFGWKTPINEGKANYNRALRSDPKDDKGTFINGKKELWYVCAIESKTQIAKFTLKPRKDGLGAKNNSTFDLDTDKELVYIDKIELFSKSDLEENVEDAVPIKTVHFEYNYSLCKNSPNSLVIGAGKLTLKKVWFTYGKNDKGRLSPYVFDYKEGDANYNPNYNTKETDRWGNYKKHVSGMPENDDFPYTEQNLTTAQNQQQAGVWSLHGIKLPSGGVINVTYEKDDYGYVQNKPAMDMIAIAGLSETTSNTPTTSIFSGPLINIKHNNRIHINLLSSETTSSFKAKYLKGVEWLYYNFLVNITADNVNKEYIGGYARIADAGIVGGSGTHAYIDMEPVEISTGPESDNDRLISPVAKTAWQFARLYRPQIVYPESEGIGVDDNPTVGDMLGFFGMMVGIANELGNMALGFNQSMEIKNICKTITVNNKSWIRLADPDEKKLGGGNRVKQIAFSDEWNNLTGDSQTIPVAYGQEYEYQTVDGKSSGVAAYEPTLGGDENPFKVPLYVAENKIPLGPDNSFFMDGPIGESHFPSPGVGYSRVTVKNLVPNVNVALKHRTGKVVHEFYTAKDFPTIVDNTPLQKIIPQSSKLKNIFSAFFGTTQQSGAASQGFSIETNDMHGKPKAQRVYAEGQTTAISETEYFYKCETGPNNTLKLVNEASLIKPDGSIAPGTLGKEIDMVFDTRSSLEKSSNYGINFNTDVILVLFGATFPMPFPSKGKNKTTSYMATTTKIVNRCGLIDKVVVTKDGSHLETRNLLYDSQTGDVLLTQTQNEFRDNEYAFTYPAHWVYDDGMGQAYKNMDARGSIAVSSGLVSLSSLTTLFMPGDELGLWQSGVFKNKAWVLDKSSTSISLIDINGISIPNGTYDYKIVRSGRRNMQSMPVGSLQTRQNIINTLGTNLDIDVDKGVINATAVEMSDKWQMLTGEGMKTGADVTDCCIHGWDGAAQTPGSCLVQLMDNLSDAGLQSSSKISVAMPTGCYDGLASSYCYSSIATVAGSGIPAPLAGHAKLSMNFYQSATPCASATLLVGQYDLYCLSPIADFDDGDFNYGEGRKGIDFTGCTYNLPLSVKQQLDDNYGDYILLKGTRGSDVYNFALIKTYWNTSAPQYFPFTQRVYMDCNDGALASNGCSVPVAEYINPYVTGIRGNWRQKKSYAFNTKRNYDGVDNNTFIRKDGEFSEFLPFWITSGTKHIQSSTLSNTDGGWQWTSEVTKYSPYGFEVENIDPLNRYSAAVYGYYNSMPIAVGNNARYNQIGYDGFEDYEFPNLFQELKGVCILKPHWNFVESADPSQLVSTQKHSGKLSLKMASNTTLSSFRSVEDMTPVADTDFQHYLLQPEDRLGLFSPQVGKYIFGAWVHSATNDFGDKIARIRCYNSSNVEIAGYIVAVDPAIKSIEKWTRVEQSFDIPAGTTKIEVLLVNSADGDVYFDDLRIHPYNGNMKSFVYDPISLRLLAQLDENNYATFYEYDEEGTLIRVKKETERGVMTIQENRQNNSK